MAEDSSFINKIKHSIDDNDHIKANLQTIILSYVDDILDARNVAYKLSEINPDGFTSTQSRVWVPAIWKALSYCQEGIPIEWTKPNIDESNLEIFNQFTSELHSNPNWCKYALYLLQKEYDSSMSDELFSDEADSYSKKIKEEMFKLKYLKYKKKYLHLKNNN